MYNLQKLNIIKHLDFQNCLHINMEVLLNRKVYSIDYQNNHISTKLQYLVEDGHGLTTISRLLAAITTLSLGRKAILTLLVLSHLVKGASCTPCSCSRSSWS